MSAEVRAGDVTENPLSKGGAPLLYRGVERHELVSEKLQRACSSVESGSPPFIELCGPSGVGKSTLLTHFFADPLISQGYIQRSDVELTSNPQKLSPEILDTGAAREFLNLVFRILGSADIAPSRKFVTLNLCRRSLGERKNLEQLPRYSGIILHDELILHRAFSILPFSSDRIRDAERYFSVVPLPTQAVICVADPQAIAERVAARQKVPNCYKDLNLSALNVLARDLIKCCFVAAEVLTRRGIKCSILSLDDAPDDCALNLKKATS